MTNTVSLKSLTPESLKSESLKSETLKAECLRVSQPARLRIPERSRFEHGFDLVCLSHLRWDFVFQRPQHLLTRCALERRVFFFEEPVIAPDGAFRLEVQPRQNGLVVAQPHVPKGLGAQELERAQKQMLNALFWQYDISHPVLWYYTPMALGFTGHLNPLAVVYDCMDELAAFRGAPERMRECEAELFRTADVVFTGGMSLFELKAQSHSNVHPFPSSVDVEHFKKARTLAEAAPDQAAIPHPRLGYCGVIDERMDLALLEGIARARPDWHIVLIGPVVKIDLSNIPNLPNIHVMGARDYKDLTSYIGGWDVALLPFALNESTRYISPTKTPEYLAAGRQVVSTPILDVVRPYGQMGLVRIAQDLPTFITSIEAALAEQPCNQEWLRRVDSFLARMSWDETWSGMNGLVQEALHKRFGLGGTAHGTRQGTNQGTEAS